MNLLFAASFLGVLQLCLGANILFLVPMPAKSHFHLEDRLIRELIKRGHRITVVSPFNMTKPPKNLTEIILPDLKERFGQVFEKNKNAEGSFAMRNLPSIYFLLFGKIGEIAFDESMQSKSMQDLLKSNEKFDLVVGSCFLVEGMLGGFGHKFQAPIVGVSTFMPNTWVNSWVGNPAPAAYVPEPLLPITHQMTFFERCLNLFYTTAAYVVYHMNQLPQQDKLMKKYFGSHLPPLRDILSKTSLVLVNHHYSLAFPRAYLPNMIEVGGYHIKPPEPLPKDIQTFMDEAKDGVILFSMGSTLSSSDFPEEKVQEILRVFSKLKQRVLWKFEKENPVNLPKNVKISKWLPQTDILAHPNIKLFITHGGLLSFTEAVFRGVPLIAIPIFGDQYSNVKFMVDLELGVKLEYDDINESKLTRAINEVLSNSKYAKNVKHRSSLMRDVPVPQIDNAIYWLEYVIRHKGAPHLRSGVQQLTWYQLYLLDVYAFLGLVLFISLFVLRKILKCIRGFFCSKNAVITQSKKEN